MLKNIKVDIIYYLTNTDFEMEFNLCGCCRMRLLTDKAVDRKSFLNMLVRAVSRSKVIIACGSLFGESGLVNIVAAAIGKGVTEADNALFGIKAQEKISIIEGSTPLVTPDGIFGGCIIESGPQTIILLSESKSIRKTIMKNLIHPYVEQIGMLPDAAEAPSPIPAAPLQEVPEEPEAAAAADLTEPPDEAAEEAEEAADLAEEIAEEAAQTDLSEEPESTSEEPEAIADDTPDFSFVIEDTDPEAEKSDEEPLPVIASQTSNTDMYIEPERVKFSEKSSYALDYTPSEKDKMFLSGENAPERHPQRGLNAGIIVVSCVLLIVLLALAYLLVYTPLSEGIKISEYINSLFEISSEIASDSKIL